MYWADIVGQDGAVRFLRRALDRGRLPHFALLWGAPGVGKTTAARALAAAALCESPPEIPNQDSGASRDEACGRCASCREFEAGIHPDLLLPTVATKDETRPLSDDDRQITLERTVRPLLADAALKGSRGERRVVIIRRAERMNEACQNTLLKTLEEPQGDRVWILTADDPSRLLPTVRSRAAPVRFARVKVAALARVLVSGGEASPEDAELVARAAEGSFSRAREMLSEDWADERRFLEEEVVPLMGSGPGAGPALARALVGRAGRSAKSARKKSGKAKSPKRPDGKAKAKRSLESTRTPALRMLGALALVLRGKLRESARSGAEAAKPWARRLEVVLASDAAVRQNIRLELALSVAAARLVRVA
ncbi:MAG: DNA polymerase III subunit [Planctomycetota bacterium]|jgi:DNA polymerase-3 subunit delta'